MLTSESHFCMPIVAWNFSTLMSVILVEINMLVVKGWSHCEWHPVMIQVRLKSLTDRGIVTKVTVLV